MVFDNCVSSFDDEKWAKVVAKADKNGDGKMQFDEFEAYMKVLIVEEFKLIS